MSAAIAIPESELTRDLASTLVLGLFLDALSVRFGGYRLIDHWKQGEFHHDVVLELPVTAGSARFLVVATNCNGGVKEVLSLTALPERGGLWHARCPASDEFEGIAPHIVAASRTAHWFDPCELLGDDARSELRPEHRVRQCGGGWVVRNAVSA